MRFNLTSAAIFILAFSAFSFGLAPGIRSGDGIIIEQITIISPERSGIRRLVGNVVVKDGVIAFVGAGIPEDFDGLKRIDGKGKFLIPGLIDSHTHLSNVAGMNGQYQRKYPKMASAYYRQLPSSYLYFGYTTLVDVNNHSPKRLDSILSTPVRPEIITCGEQLEVMNGFMMAGSKPANRRKEFPNFP